MISAWWPLVVFGFPAALLSVGFSTLGVGYKRPVFLFLGAALALPSALYLGGHSGMWPALLVPALPLLAALAVVRELQWVAATLLVPNVAVALWLTGLTVSNLLG